MTSEEIFDFYDENWNDYNKVTDMLHEVIDSYEEKIANLQKRLTESYVSGSQGTQNESEAMIQMKELLQDCQDKLDEETHKL